MRLTLHTFVTLDGVAQAPGGPDEDRDLGFEHGGWSVPYIDDEFGAAVDRWFADADAFLLGRRTYEIFAGYWPQVTDPDEPVAAKLNTLPKYVASRTLTAPTWEGTTVIGGDLVAEVERLKAEPGRELQVHGSITLADTLLDHDLVDELRLVVFPVHLGTGKRLLRDGGVPGALRCTGARTTSTGAIIATYETAGRPGYGTFGLDETGAETMTVF